MILAEHSSDESKEQLAYEDAMKIYYSKTADIALAVTTTAWAVPLLIISPKIAAVSLSSQLVHYVLIDRETGREGRNQAGVRSSINYHWPYLKKAWPAPLAQINQHSFGISNKKTSPSMASCPQYLREELAWNAIVTGLRGATLIAAIATVKNKLSKRHPTP